MAAAEFVKRCQPVDHAVTASGVGVVCSAVTALRILSGVAGASRSGLTRPSLMLAIASRIANSTEKPSRSGGSPTAFERRIVSS